MFKSRSLIFIIILAVIVRIVYMLFFLDLNNDNYWEYGYIANNINSEKGFSLFYFENDTLKQEFNQNANPYPSAFMSPLYIFYLLPFFNIGDIYIKNILIVLSQILLSIVTIIFLYRFTKLIFGIRPALISALLVAVIPEYIYITGIHNAVVQYHFLIILLFFFIVKTTFEDNLKGIIIFTIITSAIVYLRSEFFLFYLLTLVYLSFNKKFKFVSASIVIFILILSPWIIRNEIVFNKFIPLTTSSGLNLYRGNNDTKIGYWGETYFIKEINKLSNGTNFEIVYDKYYRDKALSFILNNPVKSFTNSFNKIISLWILNVSDERSFNLFYIIPSLIVTLFSIMGLIKTFNITRFSSVYIFLISTTITSAIFLTLPRYQIMMKIILIPFCAFYLNHIISIFDKKLFNSN